MKKSILLIGCVLSLSFLTGCASICPVGSWYVDIQKPLVATSNIGKATKVGTSECTSILTLIATGDASIEAAKKDAGITKVHHVDWEAKNILGIYGVYKTTVYGE